MNRETFALSQKELQRVAVISRCVKGELACARAAGLLCLSVRQIKRLKKRLREDGEAALAHASRGRPSHRRLPQAVRERIVQLARGTYAGFNDHHLCEKLVECESISLSRETLRRLLRQQGLGSPRKGRALAQLGISFIAANSPQAKGRVERLWGVLQDRLTSELRLAQAQDLDSANAVLRQFVTDYNRRFARSPRQSQPAWRPAPDNLDRICCFVHERIVSNDNVVQWQGRRFQIPQQARRFSFAGAKVQIYQALDGRVSLYYGQTRLQHSALPAG